MHKEWFLTPKGFSTKVLSIEKTRGSLMKILRTLHRVSFNRET